MALHPDLPDSPHAVLDPATPTSRPDFSQADAVAS